MSEAKSSNAAATAETEMKSARHASIQKFQTIYCDWHTARGLDMDTGPATVEAQRKTHEEYEKAERALIAASAPWPDGVMMKWEVLDFLLADAAETGPCVDNRVILTVASIKADVLRFGLRDPA